MSDLAHFDVDRGGHLPVVVLSGEIDISNAGSLREALVDKVGDEPNGLVVDLSATEYVDSAGVRLLFELRRLFEATPHGLRVVLPRESPIRRVLSLTDFDSVTPVHATVDEALATGTDD